ncbi:MAG TPA: hypothetical protein VGR97_02590 [Candidatus Acidoferrales bacterium]|nr:hypothetical protein [Candidatus Acidoferrales bacterium]
MSDPRVLPFDTDALIQLFLTATQTRSLLPLRTLRDEYGIQPAIVAEVEVELASHRKYGAKVAPEFRKALGNGTLEILDIGAMSKYVPSALAKGVFATSQSLGRRYALIVGRGEAYTHAAAVTLDVPAVSNDVSALRALDFHGHQVPSPVLRVFDLFAFALQTGALDVRDCDAARKELLGRNEHIPRAFQHAAFIDGMKSFCPRILDGAKSVVGIEPVPGPGYMTQIQVWKK